MNDTTAKNGQLAELKPAKQHSYGKYFLVLLLLTGVYQMSIKNIPPHSLSPFTAFLIAFMSVLLDVGVLYLLVLWIVNKIRRRGGVERKENKKLKLVINIIFAIIFISIISSTIITFINNPISKLTPEQSAFLKDFSREQQKLVVLNNKQKAISLDLSNIENSQEMNKILSDLLSITQEIQIQINEFASLINKNAGIFENEREKSALSTFSQSINLRERHNKKLIELTTLGLQINWDSPGEDQTNKWTKIAQELVIIETEIQSKQLDIQKALQTLTR